MTCRSCGAAIADKAIVCYRCGTPTAGPPAPTRANTRARAPWAFVVALMAVALMAVALAIVSPEHRTAIAVAGVLIAVALGGLGAAAAAGPLGPSVRRIVYTEPLSDGSPPS